ncbi:glycosyltransferase family 4 protein [Thioalkalivibrio sp. XN279]|uniref:glycosyltransferase family 4 protein n=1 Tax=Thioalkalivibrio sp. XN279 TaxID=2714953 RepID=UPI00140767A8|nr:glycosyltransferase family 4 protein [Thioalkalivibrio sp. XN279]NHA15361.1 glycosyltransferase family 4 protein [Thioalkalivibrio sp. XN279]
MKILFVTYHMPFPHVAGSMQRTALLIDALRRNHQVDIFLLRGRGQAEFLADNGYHVAGFSPLPEFPLWKKALDRMFKHIEYEYRSNHRIFSALKQVFDGGGYDLVIGRYLKASEVAGVSSLAPSLIDLDDLDTSVLANRLSSPGTPRWQRPLVRWKLRQLQVEFDKWVNRYTRCWVSSENDLALLKRDGVDVVPNIAWQMDPRPPYQPSPDTKQLLWVGSFNHPVNLAGLNRFIEQCWPAIHQAEPTAELCVVGSSLPKTHHKKWSRIPGINVLGFVENLDRHYMESTCSIVPLWDGAGTKIKVIESLSYGRTALVTAHSARGYENTLKHNESLWVANNEQDLIEGALLLLNGRDLRHMLEKNGRSIVEQLHNMSAFQRQVDASIARFQ